MRKNVLYIHTHDSGIYFQPYDIHIHTPNLDAFAKDAVCFDEAYCCSPTCSPSRASLLTGRYPHTNGMLGLGNRGFEIHDYGNHIVQRLNHEGYHTVLCGIQHEYGRYKDHQLGADKIGYQENITTSCSEYKDKDLVEWDGHNTDALCQWLKTEKKEPFFVSMGFFSTHREYPDIDMSEEELRALHLPEFLKDTMEVRKDYAGHMRSVEMFDQNFGKIIHMLKETGHYDDTLIMFTTDHGVPYPFAKCTLFDSGIHVALIMRDPKPIVKGVHIKGLVSQIDVAPTICDLLGIEKDDGYQGKSFAKVFSNLHEEMDEAVFAEINFHTSYEPARCVRTKDYKLICYYGDYEKINRSNIDNSPTKQYYMEHGMLDKEKCMLALYDLANDPLEQHNVIQEKEYQEVYQMMKQKLETWRKETGDMALPLTEDKWEKAWQVNQPACIDPKSKREEDFIQ